MVLPGKACSRSYMLIKVDTRARLPLLPRTVAHRIAVSEEATKMVRSKSSAVSTKTIDLMAPNIGHSDLVPGVMPIT